MANCKSCGARIKFIKTPAGRYIPVDPDVIFWRIPDTSLGETAEDTIVLDDGSVVKGIICMKTGTYEGYVSHFATCPQADKWRRGNK